MLSRHEIQIKKLLSQKLSAEDSNDILSSIKSILEDEVSEEVTSFKNFSINDNVVIMEDKNPILSYDGQPEGFPPSVYGQQGVIIKFDTKTMSQKNVAVRVNGDVFMGHISKIKKV